MNYHTQSRALPYVTMFLAADDGAGAPEPSADTGVPAEGSGSNPSPEGQTPAGAEGEGQGAGSPAGEAGTGAGAPAPAETSDWKDRRIARLTARLKEMQKAQTAPVENSTATDPTVAALTQAEITRLANIEAQRIAAQNEYNKACDDAAAKGRQIYGEEFNRRIAALQRTIEPTDPDEVAAYNRLLAAALETGEAPKILHLLGGDLNEAARIQALSPVKQAAALAKLAGEAPVQVSNAPKPITTIGAKGSSLEQIDPTDAERSDGLSTREWMARREKQLADARK